LRQVKLSEQLVSMQQLNKQGKKNRLLRLKFGKYGDAMKLDTGSRFLCQVDGNQGIVKEITTLKVQAMKSQRRS
jgi:hypothetical protein